MSKLFIISYYSKMDMVFYQHAVEAEDDAHAEERFVELSRLNGDDPQDIQVSDPYLLYKYKTIATLHEVKD